ncbi:MAG: hypothetical protein Q9187_003189 [Circinaria calcarea]
MSDQSSNRPLNGQQDMSSHPLFAALNQRVTTLETIVQTQQTLFQAHQTLFRIQQSTISNLTRSVNELRATNQAQPGGSGLGRSRLENRNRDRSDPHQSRGREGRSVPQQRHGHGRMPSRSRSPPIHHPRSRRQTSSIESDDSLMGAHARGFGHHEDTQRLSALPSPRPRPADVDRSLYEGSSRSRSGLQQSQSPARRTTEIIDLELEDISDDENKQHSADSEGNPADDGRAQLQQPENSAGGSRRPPTGNLDLATGSNDPQAVEQDSPPRETHTSEVEEPLDEIDGILAKVILPPNFTDAETLIFRNLIEKGKRTKYTQPDYIFDLYSVDPKVTYKGSTRVRCVCCGLAREGVYWINDDGGKIEHASEDQMKKRCGHCSRYKRPCLTVRLVEGVDPTNSASTNGEGKRWKLFKKTNADAE